MPLTRREAIAGYCGGLGGSTPDGFAAYIKTEVDRWAGIVKNSGAELE
jgi:hypothetical protein